MSDTQPEPPEREYQDAHYHDDDQDMPSNDADFDAERRTQRSAPGKKKPNRRPPPPRRRWNDD